jgi:hypothetical protein
MNDELINREGCKRKCLWPVLRYCIFLEELRETTETIVTVSGLWVQI